MTLKCKISINGTFHISQGILQIFSRKALFCWLSFTGSQGHFHNHSFIYLFQIFEWCHRDSRAEKLRKTIKEMLRLGGHSFLITAGWQTGKGLDTSPCFHPVFSGKSGQLPSLLRVSLLSDSYTDFALPPWCSGYTVEVCMQHKGSWILQAVWVKHPFLFTLAKYQMLLLCMASDNTKLLAAIKKSSAFL